MTLFKTMSSLTYERIHLHINIYSKCHSEMSRTILLKTVLQHNPKENTWQTILQFPQFPADWAFAYTSSHWIFRTSLHATNFSLKQANHNIAAGLQCFMTQYCQKMYRKLPNSNSYRKHDVHVIQGDNSSLKLKPIKTFLLHETK